MPIAIAKAIANTIILVYTVQIYNIQYTCIAYSRNDALMNYSCVSYIVIGTIINHAINLCGL